MRDDNGDAAGSASAAPPPGASKRELRRWAREVRARARLNLGAALDHAVCAALRASDHYRRARTVALYLPLGDEVDVAPLLDDDKRFVAPRTHVLPAPHLTFHLLAGAELEHHPWGVRQPRADAPRVELREIDLMLVPGLLFDVGGARLGYGKGYYDRLLAPGGAQAAAAGPQAAPTTVGVTFEALVMEELPSSPHDVAVDYLATEAGVRISRRGAPRPPWR